MLITAQYHTPVLVSQGTWLPRRIHSQVPVMPACFFKTLQFPLLHRRLHHLNHHRRVCTQFCVLAE